MMFDAAEDRPDLPALVRLHIDDCDATYRQALAAGAEPVTELTEFFFGDKVGHVRDPFCKPVVDPGPAGRSHAW